MFSSNDAKQTNETKANEHSAAAHPEQPGLYWAVAPQPRRVRR